MNDKPIFRKVALDRLSSPEQLDQLITVTSPKGWVALATMAAIIAAVIAWGIFGSIATKVNGTGMILAPGGMTQVTTVSDGQIADIFVTPGSAVRPGQLIATLAQPSLSQELERLRSEMTISQNQSDTTTRQAKLAQLQQQLAQASQVIAATGGTVVDIKAAKGDFVRAGTSLVTLKGGDSAKLEAVLFVPVEEGRKIRPGLDAQVAPSMIRSDEHGFLVGKVTSVSDYPVTAERMLQVLGTKELVQKFSGTNLQAPLEVRIALTEDSSTRSGYLWTSLTGPPQSIPAGTVCSASLVIKRQRPVSMVFLQLNQLLRSE